jgi:peptidyl-tRNA hydrolase, PTH1 family
MTAGISLIAGLGNPGAEYADTRHNAGFRLLAALLAGTGQSLQTENRFAGRVARMQSKGRDVWLLAPDTFMNHSGDAVSKLARYYKIPVEEILVVHDELDLPPGTVRLKKGGGPGGHNGISDVIEKLGSPDFLRLRIGIGRPSNSAQMVSFVLKKAPKAEQELIDAAIHDALQHIDDIVHGQTQKVMNALHTHTR